MADSNTPQSVRKASGVGVNNSVGLALVPSSGSSKILKQSKEVNDFLNVIFYLQLTTLSEISNAYLYFQILFPYDEFIEYFNWDNRGFPPCGLINCGNRFDVYHIHAFF